jgi:hypothetical protein
MFCLAVIVVIQELIIVDSECKDTKKIAENQIKIFKNQLKERKRKTEKKVFPHTPFQR